jgi:single-stranded-DNA-specific exonuclease
MEIKNLNKAAKRIIKAINSPAGEKEKIILYGDADLDGAASVIILEETIKTLGGKIEHIYFPDREVEGYGINKKALEEIKNFAPALLIAVDLGIGNFEEVEIAKKMGFEVIIVDHHEILGKIPKADIVVDPKQKGDKYPFKFFAAAGLAFKLSQEILGKQMTESLQDSFLEIVALATIADMMPQTDDNLELTEKGSRLIPNSWRPGIKAFFEIKEINDDCFEKEMIGKIVTLLNVKHIEDRFPAPYKVLKANSTEEAKSIIKILLQKRIQKRENLNFMVEEMEKNISKNPEKKIIFQEYSDDLNLLGSSASVICNNHQKPTFIYREKDGNYQGVTRMPEGLNGIEAMQQCKDLFITFGGHPGAGGFTIKKENFEEFKKCVEKYFDERIK